MEFSHQTMLVVGLTALLSLPANAGGIAVEVVAPMPAPEHLYQIEAMLGINHAWGTPSALELGFGGDEEIDTLHRDGFKNKAAVGGGLGYNVLPYLIANYGTPDNQFSYLRDVIVGLDVIFFDTTQTGDVYLFQDPMLSEYTYRLKYKTARLMVNTEIGVATPWERLYPYFQASFGDARVSAGYHDYIKPQFGEGLEIRVEPQTTYRFTYSVGAGMKFLITPDLQLSLSYLYTDFGTVSTINSFIDESVNVNPVRMRLRTSTGMLGLACLF